MTPLEKDALPGALLDPLIARLKGRWFSTTEIPVIISALTKCREALSSAHAQEAAEQSLIEEAAFIRRQETDRASPAQAPTGGAGALDVMIAALRKFKGEHWTHWKGYEVDLIDDVMSALAAGIPAAPVVIMNGSAYLGHYPIPATPAQPPADLKDREAQEVRAALVELVEAHDYVEADPMDDRDIPRSLWESARRALGSKT